ncbi:MAG: PAS domain S-box protein [Flavobacteriales bacterium]|nr:PAS domain S-box protein [Flavobacteriales bacterium]
MSQKRDQTSSPGAGTTGLLVELRRRYDQLLEGNLAGIFRTTLDGRFIECNDTMAHVLGYSGKAELLACNASELYFSSEDRKSYLEELRRDGRLLNYEIRLKHKSGKEVIVQENVFFDTTGSEPTVLGMFMDITSLKQAEAEQRTMMAGFRGLVERMRDGLIVVQDGVVQYANPAAIAFVGSDIGGRPIDSLFPQQDREAIRSMIKEALVGNDRESITTLGDTELLVFCGPTLHGGRPAAQIALQDNATRDRVLRDRVQLRIAQEVNQVLREEIEMHRRTQEELRQSKRFARSLIDSSLDMIMAADQHGRITEYNPAACMRFAYEADEVWGLDTRLLYADPEEYNRVQAELERHGVYAGEIRNRDKYGNVFTSFLSASKLYDEEGRVIGVMGVSRDITRMMKDQEALKASEERYRDLIESATDLIQSISPDGRLEYVNEAWRRTLGYSKQEVSTMAIGEIIHPPHADAWRNHLESTMRGERLGVIRTVMRAKDGQPITVEGSISVRREDGVPVAARCIFRDISGALEARKQLDEHEAKWKALFESSEHMFWTVDEGIRITSFNQGYSDMIHRLYGVRPQLNRDPNKPRQRFASDEYHALWEERYREAFGGRANRFETDRFDTEGRRVCNEVFLSPVVTDGRVVEVFGIGHEITEQKEAEDTVRDQAARIKAIFESSANMMIWTLDRELCLTGFNPHFQRSIREIHGIQLELGDSFPDRMAERLAPAHVKPLLIKYGNALRGKPQQFEVELIDLRGDPAWVENFLNPIVVDGEVNEIACLAYGITDRKQAQRALEQSVIEKEILLKEVHHRVKNNLQVISSITKLQERREGLDTAVREMLHHSRDRVRSMALIHERLYMNKQFSSIDLADYIEGLTQDLVSSYSTGARVQLRLDLQPVHLGIDQAMPCGLLLNEIISNALKHAFASDRAGALEVSLSIEEDTVRISVADNGPGLPAGFDEERDGGLGMELVGMLTAQLDGSMQRNNRSGLSYLLTFERDNRKPHGADERLGR